MADRKPYNDDFSPKGVEGWTQRIDNRLVVYINPTDSREDWISNFKAWPERLCPGSKIWVHAGYRAYAYWLKGYLQAEITRADTEEVILIGYSMGGGIAQVLYVLARVANGAIRSVSDDYTIGDQDADIIEVETGASNRTITLPTLVDNIGRIIKIVKADSGAGNVVIDGEGAETINGSTTISLTSQYDVAIVIAGSGGWYAQT
jgi:hypothetical protein